MRTVDVHINWKCRFEKEILTYKTSSFPVVYINVFILAKFISVSEINGSIWGTFRKSLTSNMERHLVSIVWKRAW